MTIQVDSWENRLLTLAYAPLENWTTEHIPVLADPSALDLAYVAAGRLDGYFEIGLKPWDVAAGALLVREAGGVVTDFLGNDKVEESDSILAAPFKLMTPMRRIVEPRWSSLKGE